MARKRRRQTSHAHLTDMAIPNRVGIYARISRSDGDPVSESIANQIQLATNYIHDHQELVEIKIYTDDGYSGLNFNRPGFQELLHDIDTGIVNCILIKDPSRLGRNYLKIGKLLSLFSEMGIRLISINTCYDSANPEQKDDLEVVLQSVIDQRVSVDISKRVSGAIEAKQKSGSYIPPAGSIPYGYLRDNEHCTYVVDSEAAVVVQRIYHLRAQGYSISAICNHLNEKGIPSPSKLKYLRKQSEKAESENALWGRSTIRKILNDQTYIGNRVHGKFKKYAPAGTKHRTDSDTWTVVEHAHPAIISSELFQQIQTISANDNKHTSSNDTCDENGAHENILAGKVFCGDCGKTMKAAKSGKTGVAYYNCSNYKEFGALRCKNHYISKEKILTTIRCEIENLLSAGFLPVQSNTILANYQAQLDRIIADEDVLVQKQECLTMRFMAVHEAYALENISKEDTRQRNAALSVQRTSYNAQEEHLAVEKAVAEDRIRNFQQLIQMLHEYEQTHRLTTQQIDILIERISVFQNQDMTIQFWPEELNVLH